MPTENTGPVESIPSDARREPDTGIAICLSGGGYRAMVFHLGALLRLVELGYLNRTTPPAGGAFGKLERVSSVSGGSITSAVLASCWQQVDPDSSDAAARFKDAVIGAVRGLAEHTIDAPSILTGLLPFVSVNARIIKAYDKHLFNEKTLQVFPDHPRFVINATNLQSGALWRFMKPYIRDWKVGKIPKERRTVSIATAVAASSAFPPVLSPAPLKFDVSDYEPGTGGGPPHDLQRPPFTTRPVLSDGGVYDNLGLETAWKRYKTILVSDAGGRFDAEPKVPSAWVRQSVRVLGVIDNQVRSLRKRQVIDSYVAGERTGAYWGIRTDIADYGLDVTLPCPVAKTTKLADTPTRLKAIKSSLQKRLVNWGYAVCDAAIRAHVDTTVAPPQDFPYPEEGVG